ncbi:MAG: DUF1488 family protein [Shewanella sp.]|uniref:DUF1488 family protein n=1 Tax=Shewanella sp. SNU WT4 TaxID=2590015 RepID=UPI00143D6A4F|nr:DUF1488 family protein [Shewanella sp. SNU WT4]
MNQAIIFTDLQQWQAQLQVMVLPVQINGTTLDCHIGLGYLLAGQAMTQDVELINAAFDAKRFDIEDELEQIIEALGGEIDAPICLE